MSVKVTNQNTPTATTDQLLIVEAFDGTPTPNGRLRQGVYYSFQNTWRNFTEKLGLDKIFVPLIRTITINGTTKSLDQNIDFTVSGGVSDGNKGDITVSGSGATWTINNDAVTNDKIDSVDATKVNEDTTHRFVTDTEKSTWNGKQNALGYTPENVANKQSAVSTNADHYYNSPYINTIIGTCRRLVASTTTNVSFTAVNTNETVLLSVVIPAGTYGVGRDPFLNALVTKAGTASTTAVKLRTAPVGSVLPLTSQPVLGNASGITSANSIIPFTRNFIHIHSASSTIVTGANTVNDGREQMTVFNSLNIDWTVDQEVKLTIQSNNISADTWTGHRLIAEI